MPRTFRFVAAGALACIAGPVLAQPVTSVVTHGQQTGGKSAWLEGMADAIIARAGSGAVLRYREIDGAWQLVSGVLDENEPVALIFRWIDDQAKAGTDRGYAEGAGDALYAALRDPRFADAGGAPLPAFPLVEGRFLHLLGHSRGPIVNSEAVRRFGAAGVTVDHVTTMDPHPVDGTLDPPLFDEDWGDPMPQRWSNVTFADNYWRADGGGFINGFDFDGIPIPFTLDVELSESALNCCAYPLAHSDVHLWYHGTIDTGPTANDGDQAITTTMRNTWWPEGFTERGFY